MKTIRKNKKQWMKFIVLLLIIIITCIIGRDSFVPVITQVFKTPFPIVFITCMVSLGYFIFEGINLWRLSLRYNPSFTLWEGIGCAFYACFYRTITMGSASFAAGMYYLNRKGVPLANTLSLITVQYVSLKIAIAIFTGCCLLFDFDYMHSAYGDYFPYIIAGFFLTLLITVVLILICSFRPLHTFLLYLGNKLNRSGKYTEKLNTLTREFESLREGTFFLMKDFTSIVFLIVRNLIRLLFWYTLPCFLFGNHSFSEFCHTISITSLVTALAGVIPSPAGIGSTEFLFTAFFSPVYGTTLAVSSMLLYRFATFIFPFLVGIMVVMCYDDKK